MAIEDDLVSLGFDRNDAKVYLALLRLKSATAGEISKKADMHRRSVYDTLEKLIDRGLVTYIIKNDVKYFQPADLSRLIEMIKKKERILQSLLPQLASLESGRMEETVTVYEGVNGLKTILNAALEIAKGDEIIGFGDNGKVGGDLLPLFMEKWHRRRVASKIRIRSIFNDMPEARKRMSEVKRTRMMDARIMPIPFTSYLGAWVCKDRTVLWLLSEKPIAIAVKSEEMADGFKDYFNVLWGIAKKG